ncbi:hypothetical protein BaRGS_00005760 [Batillaria attramentaria]|uniref:Uncharacterized protein n=1 Tax=Batillaria attramentaria TaxID=370345 RepID=A0ABD0LU41_9CAEN
MGGLEKNPPKVFRCSRQSGKRDMAKTLPFCDTPSPLAIHLSGFHAYVLGSIHALLWQVKAASCHYDCGSMSSSAGDLPTTWMPVT